MPRSPRLRLSVRRRGAGGGRGGGTRAAAHAEEELAFEATLQRALEEPPHRHRAHRRARRSRRRTCRLARPAGARRDPVGAEVPVACGALLERRARCGQQHIGAGVMHAPRAGRRRRPATVARDVPEPDKAAAVYLPADRRRRLRCRIAVGASRVTGSQDSNARCCATSRGWAIMAVSWDVWYSGSTACRGLPSARDDRR